MKHLFNFFFLFAVSIASLASAETFSVDGATYETISSTQVRLKSVSNKETITDFDIPTYVANNYQTYVVTEIGYQAFMNCTNLESVIIPYSVRTIESGHIPTFGGDVPRGAFANCTNLTHISLPTNLTSIGSCAFYNCDGLISIDIPNSVTQIGTIAFKACDKLEQIKIGNSVNKIGEAAFIYCDSLKSVHISDLTSWCNIEFDEHYANPLKYARRLYLNGQRVDNLIIPSTVDTIKAYSFSNLDCSSVTIPSSVKRIEKYAFYDNSSLNSVHISDLTSWCNIEFDNSYANPLFYARRLYLNGQIVNNLRIPSTVNTIKAYTFYGLLCNSVTIPSSVRSIESYAFDNLLAFAFLSSSRPTLKSNALSKNTVIAVPTESLSSYQSVWGEAGWTIIPQPTPITPGYYYIVSAGKGSGYPFSDDVLYDDEERYALFNKDGFVSWKRWDESMADEIYEFTSDGNDNWYVKNLVDASYINTGTGTYACKVTTSTEPITAQTFMPSVVTGKWTIQEAGRRYVYALTGSHNGAYGKTTDYLNIWGTAAEASNGKMNLWYLIPVSDEAVLKTAKTTTVVQKLLSEADLLYNSRLIAEDIFTQNNALVTQANDNVPRGTQGNQFLCNRKEASEGRYGALIDGIIEAHYNSSGEFFNNGSNFDENGEWAHFHSAWATVANAGAHSQDELDFMQVDISRSPVSSFILRTAPRYNNTNAQPTCISIYATNDTTGFYNGVDTWTRITDIHPKVCVPGEYYASPIIDLGSEYKYIRFVCNKTQTGVRYFTYSEFQLYQVPESIDSEVRSLGQNIDVANEAIATHTCLDEIKVSLENAIESIKFVRIKGITINGSSLNIVEGNTVTLSATIAPVDATNQTIIWASSNDEVAIVENGIVTAVAPGSATITATATDGSNVKATCEVTVAKDLSTEIAELESLVASAQTTCTNAVEGTTVGNYNPGAKAALQAVIDEVSSTISASMTEEQITEGTTKINDALAVFESEKVRPVASVELSETSLIVTEGTTVTLSVAILPENATNKNITWTSSNEDVATVEDGVVTAVSPGTATITATTADGTELTASCEVTVESSLIIGDVNGDGAVSITDAVAVVNIVLGNDADDLSREPADINNDGEITITDVVGVINLILNATGSSASSKSFGEGVDSDLLSIGDVIAEDNNNVRVMIKSLEGDFTASQFDIVLPAGVELEDIEPADRRHSVSYTENNGVVRVVCYSFNNDEFRGGNIVELKLRATGEVGAIDFSSIELTRSDLSNVSARSQRLYGDGLTGINANESSASKTGDIYDLNGRKVNDATRKGTYIVNGKKVKL